MSNRRFLLRLHLFKCAGGFLTPESWLHEEDCGHTSANYSYLHQGRVVGFGSH